MVQRLREEGLKRHCRLLVEQAAAAAQSLQDQAVKLNAAVAVFSVV
jgi:methyl-accepting chemotaxis protein